MRKSKLVNLVWEQVDFYNETIRV
ncbi:hypothetical protein ACFQ3N_16740 [Virgibacillus byunsanensis]|uniref:Uncharacterized protein n=1 Tax=Virgibacillus byunsanensis TaxID=570945 RepID=A0ABW3LNT4_9BACI